MSSSNAEIKKAIVDGLKHFVAFFILIGFVVTCNFALFLNFIQMC